MGFSQYVQMFIHFVLAECLGIIMFYVGLRSYLAINSNWISTHIIMGNNGVYPWKTLDNLGQELDCVLSNAYAMMESYDPNFAPSCIGPVGHAGLGPLQIPFNYFVTTINLMGLALVIAFIVVMCIELMASSATNIGQGRYLSFSYRVTSRPSFQVCRWILVTFILLIIADIFRFLITLGFRGEWLYIVNYSEYLLPTILSVGFSAYHLSFEAADPFFNYESEEFQELQFSRGWADVFTCNKAFGTTLGLALLSQKRQRTKDMEALLSETFEPKCSTPEEVMKVCDMASEKDSLLPAEVKKDEETGQKASPGLSSAKSA